MRNLVLTMLAVAALSSCRTMTSDSSSAVMAAGDPVQQTDIKQNFGSGTKYEIAIDPSREIDQVTVSWNGQYSIVLRDQNGSPRVNDEGKPMYKDGMYAYGKIMDGSGNLREIAPKKFVDANETDNWHDLQGVRGNRLVIEFWHSHDYSNDPQVLAAHRQIFLQRVLVRYKDDPNARYQDYVFNPNYDDLLSSQARYVQNGGTFTQLIPASLNVYRVDVRWGDAKPRVNGVYVPGTATGRLKFNGQWQGAPRNVAAIETQTWAGLNYPPANGGNHTIVVSFMNDDARIHSIRVYYNP